ncbi:MAG TPA: hypothetical protein DD001_10510 [Microcoleaceae bacterium UBA10368]|jgi:hypothetical protein|nr:hypothetical protein [Microcoleaceae cyanobacterium UBA10368]HCV31823.1 hypothetical protein [Microcoleaceae cyanobacterium UBA9251]
MTTTTHTHTFSDHDAALLAAKQNIATESDTAAKTWRAYLFSDPQAAANYANIAPAQGPGEIIFSVLPDGKVWVFPYF